MLLNRAFGYCDFSFSIFGWWDFGAVCWVQRGNDGVLNFR